MTRIVRISALVAVLAAIPLTSIAADVASLDYARSAIENLDAAGQISHGNAMSLIAKIDAAIAALDRGNTTAATALLTAAIREVAMIEQRGSLTADQADLLTQLLEP